MNNYFQNILNKYKFNESMIVLAKKINSIFGCQDSISKDTLYRWFNENISDKSNKKQKGIVCFCLYFRLCMDEIYNLLKYLKIEEKKQIDKIIQEITFKRENTIFSFYGNNISEIVEFSMLLMTNNLAEKTSIFLHNTINEEYYFDNFLLNYTNNNFIRNIMIDKLSIGCKNSTLEDMGLKDIQFSIQTEYIEKVLCDDSYLRFNFYKQNSLANINIKEYCSLNQIDFVLVYLKNQKINYCPIYIFLDLFNKKLPIDKQRRVFESLKLLEDYPCCSNTAIKTLISALEIILSNKNLDHLIQIYIIESLSCLYKYDLINNFSWNIAKKIINNNIINHHIIWAILIMLIRNEKTYYSHSDKELVLNINHIIIRDNILKENTINNLMEQLKVIINHPIKILSI